MAAEKTLGLVLRVIEFSETSCIVHLYTRDFGKISALAKGARRPKSPFEAALDLLAVCRVVFLRKSSDALDLLTEARLERRFRAATRDLTRLYAGYYVVELLRELTDQGDPQPELFDAAVGTVRALDGVNEPFGAILHFEWTALRLIGHLPALAECVGCGLALDAFAASGRVSFGMLAGGVLCGECRAGQRSVVSISGRAWQVLRHFADATDDTWEQIEVPGGVRGELRAVMNQYVSHLVGRPLRMPAYLHALRASSAAVVR